MADNEWTDELKTDVVTAYEERNPTPENTMDIVKELATEFEKTPNGVRMVLTRASVYIKKAPASSASSSDSKGKSTRVNKAEAITALKAKIKAVEFEVDDDICDRLTGKAAVYIHSILEAVTPG